MYKTWFDVSSSFQECLKFLKEIQSGGSQDFSTKAFHDPGAVSNLYLETSSTFMKVLSTTWLICPSTCILILDCLEPCCLCFSPQVLKAHTGLITSSQLAEEMEKLHAPVLDPNPRLQNGGVTDSSTSDGYSDDIEAEANSYFQQMFSGQLTIDAMVQMLARFKESSVKRLMPVKAFPPVAWYLIIFLCF